MKASSRRGLAEINESFPKSRKVGPHSFVVGEVRARLIRQIAKRARDITAAAGANVCCRCAAHPCAVFEALQQRRGLQPLPLPLMRARLLPVPLRRPLSDQTVFSSVACLLRSVQEQGDCLPPRSVLRSALYLLAAAQDKSPDLDEVKLSLGPFCLSCIACMQVKRFMSATSFYV